MRVFADLHPEEVVGMVLIDPTQEAFMQWLRGNFPRVNRLSGADRARQDEWGCQFGHFWRAAAKRGGMKLPRAMPWVWRLAIFPVWNPVGIPNQKNARTPGGRRPR